MKASDLNDLLTQVSGMLAAVKTNVSLHDLELVQTDLIPLLQATLGASFTKTDSVNMVDLLQQLVTTGTALLLPRADGTLLIDQIAGMVATIQGRPLELATIALFL